MKYYVLEPEVAGGFGDNNISEGSSFPPRVIHFHHQFDGWCGDEILECFPCYLVTEALARRIQQAKLSGVEFGEVEVSFGEQFHDIYGDKPMPNFIWLKPKGVIGSDDFALLPDARLVVSVEALSTILEGHPNVLRYSPIAGDFSNQA